MNEKILKALEDKTGKPVIQNLANRSVSDFQDWAESQDPKAVFLVVLMTLLDGEKEIIGAVDVNHGADLLFDGVEWHRAKQGIFTEEWIFVSDYYGYPKGGLFKRMEAK